MEERGEMDELNKLLALECYVKRDYEFMRKYSSEDNRITVIHFTR